MAPTVSNAKALSGLITKAINGGSATTKAGAVVKKAGDKAVGSGEKVAWVPDPRTGFYRPANVVEEIDVAELRAALLKKH